MSETRSEKRKTKELKVLELHHQGYSSRKIATLVHLSLRDITKFVNLASNKIKSPSVTSIHDEIILEYRVNFLRSEVRELECHRKNLKDELDNLRAQKIDMQDELRARESEIEEKMRYEIDSIIYDKEMIFLISFFALGEALRNHPNIKLLLFDLIISQDIPGASELSGKSVAGRLKNNQFALAYYNKLLPLYQEYLTRVGEIIHEELLKSYALVRTKKG